jgi:hypothetical protein
LSPPLVRRASREAAIPASELLQETCRSAPAKRIRTSIHSQPQTEETSKSQGCRKPVNKTVFAPYLLARQKTAASVLAFAALSAEAPPEEETKTEEGPAV